MLFYVASGGYILDVTVYVHFDLFGRRMVIFVRLILGGCVVLANKERWMNRDGKCFGAGNDRAEINDCSPVETMCYENKL